MDGAYACIPAQFSIYFLGKKSNFIKVRSRLVKWFNPSVRSFAAGEDPVEKIVKKALSVALNAIQEGWKGPPFDPFELAERLRIKTVAKEGISDARTVPISGGRFQIEYNPSRPRQRIRFSIAHELAHTFFPDCAERVRYRASGKPAIQNEWELELLCNLAAAELLMPTGSLPDFRNKRLSMEGLLELRKKFEVSAESIALRYMHMTRYPAAMFVAARSSENPEFRYRIDYALSSRTCAIPLQKGDLLPGNTVVEECTAIGYVAQGTERWGKKLEEVQLEVVGLPPYSGSAYPRVLGLLYSCAATKEKPAEIEYIIGDATHLTGNGNKILVLIVNDKTPNWGAGFGNAVRNRWPAVQEAFRVWTQRDRSNLSLGRFCTVEVSDGLIIAPLICQHGYGPSEKPRIRYAALSECLFKIGALAKEKFAAVHMPRIGSGYAGGDWEIIEQIIDENLCRQGVFVMVYDLPSQVATQHSLFGSGD